LDSYKYALKIKPDFADAYRILGIILDSLGRLKQAEATYKQAIVLKPNCDEVHRNLGVLLFYASRYEEAAVHFELSDFENSKHYLLRCLYVQDKKTLFYEQLDGFINQG
jgi:Flp pilus assembly protein TadD